MVDNEMEKLIAELIRKTERRFFGKYRGVVSDNNDPEHLGRLRVEIPSVLGSGVVSGWATPCVPYGGNPNSGYFFIPEVGAGVWVEFEEGDLEFPIWVGTYWSKPGGNTELPMPLAADGAEQSDPPDPQKQHIIKTAMGHTIQLIDDEENGMVLVKDGVNEHCVTMDSTGINITDGANGHSVIMNENGITVTDKVNSGNSIVMERGKIVINSQKIYLGTDNDNQKMVKGSMFQRKFELFTQQLTSMRIYLSSHCHTGNLGAPTSPPTLPPPVDPILMNINCDVPLSDNHLI